MDEKIKLKQEQEEFKVIWTYLSGYSISDWSPNIIMWLQAQLKTMREAALWRRSQGEFHNVERGSCLVSWGHFFEVKIWKVGGEIERVMLC